LAVSGSFDPATSGLGAAQLLAKSCQKSDIEALEAALNATRTEMATLIEHKLEASA